MRFDDSQGGGRVYDDETDWDPMALYRACTGQPPADGQAPVTDDAAPVAIDETPTKRIRTLSDAELLAELEQHAECGGVR